MSDISHEQSVPAAVLAKAEHALLLARIAASAVAIACFATGELALTRMSNLKAMLDELGMANIPGIVRLLVEFQSPLLLGVPVLFLATLGFIWARGKTSAWMAAIGLLLMIVVAPLATWALLAPLVQIITEMGAM